MATVPTPMLHVATQWRSEGATTRHNKAPRPVWAGGGQETSMARAQTHWSSRRTLVAYRARLLRLEINRSLRENLPYHKRQSLKKLAPPNVNKCKRPNDVRKTKQAFCNLLPRLSSSSVLLSLLGLDLPILSPTSHCQVRTLRLPSD